MLIGQTCDSTGCTSSALHPQLPHQLQATCQSPVLTPEAKHQTSNRLGTSLSAIRPLSLCGLCTARICLRAAIGLQRHSADKQLPVKLPAGTSLRTLYQLCSIVPAATKSGVPAGGTFKAGIGATAGNRPPVLMSRTITPGGDHPGCHQGRSVRCNGYVGEGTAPAGEYHNADFSWEEHCTEVQAMIAADPVRWRHIARDSIPCGASEASEHSQIAEGSLPCNASNAAGHAQRNSCHHMHGSGESASLNGKSHQATPDVVPAEGSSTSGQSIESTFKPEAGQSHDSRSQSVRDRSHPLHQTGLSALSEQQALRSASNSLEQSCHSDQHEEHQTSAAPATAAADPLIQSPVLGLSSLSAEEGLEDHSSGYSISHWEAFHAQDNRSGRFYKERRCVQQQRLQVLNFA